MKSFFLITLLFIFFSCNKSETNYGKDFVGVWESKDGQKIKFEIKELYREGKKIDNRYELKIIDNKSELPNYYIQEGQYNYQLVTAKPQYNLHPFKEFIHLNAFLDTISYLGLKEDNQILVRKYRIKNIPELEFRKIKR